MNRIMLNRLIIAGAIALIVTGCKPKQNQGPIAYDMPETATEGKLEISCRQFAPGGAIPLDYTGYGAGKAPDITWKRYPKGTRTMWLIIEDPDAPGTEPFVHWLLSNIDPTTHQTPGGGFDRLSSTGNQGYYAPKPPAGPPHRYYFELFALDKPLDATDRDTAVREMKGHVLAKGEFMCTFQKP